jgi:P-type E1-E2 ATPase
MGAAWLDWIYRALVLLVVACPCALVISTPVSIVSGLAAAARHGILIKGGVYLEEGRKLRWLALDKTGTITHGKPAQTDFVAWGNALASDSRSIAASLAARSDHPVSKAVAQAAQRMGLPCSTWPSSARCPVGVCKAKSTVRPTIWATTGCSKSWGSAHQSWSSASLRWKPQARPS